MTINDYYARANVCYSIGDYQQAIKLLKNLFRIAPDNPIISKALAMAFYKNANYNRAYKYYLYSYQLDNTTTNCDCIFYAGHCLIKLGKEQPATVLLQQFISICDTAEILRKPHQKKYKYATLLINKTNLIPNNARNTG